MAVVEVEVSSQGKVEEVVDKAEVKITKISQVSLVSLVKARKARTLGKSIPGTRRPGTQTCPRSSHAPVTGFLERLLIFVKSQVSVHGKIFGCQRAMQINEIQADPKK